MEQLRYPCLMSRPIEVLPRTADEDGLLASSSTFLPLRKKLTLSRKQAREASEGGCEFEVCMLLPEAVTSPSPCFRVQIPGEWLPDHLREPRDEQAENGSENATKSGPEEVLSLGSWKVRTVQSYLVYLPRSFWFSKVRWFAPGVYGYMFI